MRLGVPFYTTYAAVKAGLARFSESLRRELKGEGIHVLTVYLGGTDTPMMKSNRAGPDLGFGRESATFVGDSIVEGMEADAFEVIRCGESRANMIALNHNDPAAIDDRFLKVKSTLSHTRSLADFITTTSVSRVFGTQVGSGGTARYGAVAGLVFGFMLLILFLIGCVFAIV
jgi:NAD(P)-dependent dehydrogenase (short-subunit alcohol dehydrogenase family)